MTGRILEHSAGNIESAIKEAVLFLPKNFTPRHEHSKRCFRILEHILYPDEYTVIEAKQSLLKSITQTRLVATNQRIISVKPSFWSLWAGRNIFSSTNYESIPYSNVINIALSTGMIFSTLSIHLSTNANSGENNVDGLKIDDAKAMFIFLEKMTDTLRKQSKESTIENIQSSSNKSGDYVDMETARKFIKYKGSKIIWLGAEPLELAAERLDISKDAVIKMNIDELMRTNKLDSGRLEGSILVCYTGDFAANISKYLKETYGVRTYVLSGGVEYQMKKIYEIA